MLSIQHILALNALPGMTSAAMRALLECGASLRDMVNAPPEDLASLGLKRGAIDGMRSIERHLEWADAQIVAAERFDANIIHILDARYPERLRQIYSAPPVIYVRGELFDDRDAAIAIVGTRGASIYGRLAAENYATTFARAGVTVVSGLARGIDQFAHAATMSAGGRTIAVVASGLDQIQPAHSAQLSARIASQGAVVSEYAMGVKAVPAYFPQRNRIISGLTSGTVVIESDQRGGALITAGFALDQNRDVFALPGPVTSPKSRGTNMLIRTDRARLTQTPEDVLDALGYHIPVAEMIGEKPPLDLNAFEQRIYEALGEEPAHVDALCEATGFESSEVLVSLLGLEFKGVVRQMAGKMFVRL